MSAHTWTLAPVLIHQEGDWNTERTVNRLPYPSVLLAVMTLTFLAFFPLRSTRFGQSLEKCPGSPQVKQVRSLLSLFGFFFLKVVVFTGLLKEGLKFPLFLPEVFPFCYTKLAVAWPSPFSVVSLARAFPSTSRDAIKFSTDISCLLCLRAMAKFLYEGGNLAIMQPATNLSGKAHLRSLSSLAMHCISWAY
jgi:hypothetical protein